MRQWRASGPFYANLAAVEPRQQFRQRIHPRILSIVRLRVHHCLITCPCWRLKSSRDDRYVGAATDLQHEKQFAMSSIQSPCILICSIDDKTGFCFGCGRTGNEIGAWTAMSADERDRILTELPERLQQVKRPPRRMTRRRRMAEGLPPGET